MKTFRVALLTVLVGAGFTVLAIAQQKSTAPQGAKPGALLVEVITFSGKVTAVDYTKRTVTVQEPGGKTVTLNAKNARNLDQVKVGDTVKTEYVEELAIFVRKADSPPSAMEAQMVELAPKGQKPAGLMADTVQITADVEAIDYQKRTIALKGPAGNVRTFKVDKSVKNFDEIKKGDQVVLQFTEALALAVVKP
jgi:ribosomal 50S subunit-recycling heat shock protein